VTVISDWGQAVLTAISDAFRKLFGFLPDLIGALLILWIGWIIAGILAKLVTNILRKIRFNEATEKAGLNRFLQSAGVRQDASAVMGEIVKWFFRIIALLAAFSVLQLPALTAALTGILNFIPNLIVALVIILIGSLVANFVRDFVKGAAGSAGFSNAGLLANIARYAILYVAVIAALGQIGIAEVVINTLFIGTIAALALALGLAFGLGGRETAGKILENTYNSAQENLPKLGNGLKRQAQRANQPAVQAPPVQHNAPFVEPAPGFQPGVQTRNYPQPPPQPQGQFQPPQGQGYSNNYPVQPDTGNPEPPRNPGSGSPGNYPL
jgi:small-conductance mechanosensitive channel